MKVALCTESVYPLYGVERRVYEMAIRFKKYNINVNLYSSTPSEIYTNIRMVTVSRPTIIKPPKRNYTFCLSYWKNLYKELIKTDFDIIDANGHLPLIPCSLAGKFRKMPVVATIHDLYLTQWRGLYSFSGAFFGLPLEVLMVKMPYTKIVTINTSLKQRLIRTLNINENNISVIPSGINFEYIQSLKEKEKNGNIIYVGRLVPQKNIDILIESIKKIPKTTLKIIGEGTEFKNLEKLSVELGIKDRVIFLGGLKNYDDVLKEIKKSSLLVLPSIRENFGIVPLEAMACSTPVISTNTEGPRDYIVDGVNGFLSRIGDVNDLVDKISLVLNNSDLSKRFIRCGMSTAKKYDWDVIVNKIVKLYQNILN